MITCAVIVLLLEIYRVVVRLTIYILSIRLTSSLLLLTLVPHCPKAPYLPSLFFYTLNSRKEFDNLKTYILYSIFIGFWQHRHNAFPRLF